MFHIELADRGNQSMTAQTQVTSTPVPPLAPGQPEQPASKQPWRRPSVAFVPMQATADGKSGIYEDQFGGANGQPTPPPI